MTGNGGNWHTGSRHDRAQVDNETKGSTLSCEYLRLELSGCGGHATTFIMAKFSLVCSDYYTYLRHSGKESLAAEIVRSAEFLALGRFNCSPNF